MPSPKTRSWRLRLSVLRRGHPPLRLAQGIVGTAIGALLVAGVGCGRRRRVLQRCDVDCLCRRLALRGSEAGAGEGGWASGDARVRVVCLADACRGQRLRPGDRRRQRSPRHRGLDRDRLPRTRRPRPPLLPPDRRSRRHRRAPDQLRRSRNGQPPDAIGASDCELAPRLRARGSELGRRVGDPSQDTQEQPRRLLVSGGVTRPSPARASLAAPRPDPGA